MAHDITVYQKPTCTTCRQVYAALKEGGVDFDAVNYFTDPFPKEKLVELLAKMGIGPRELLRTREPLYASLDLASSTHTDDELVALMVAHPELIQRPIVERGDRAILARAAEKLREIF